MLCSTLPKFLNAFLKKQEAKNSKEFHLSLHHPLAGPLHIASNISNLPNSFSNTIHSLRQVPHSDLLGKKSTKWEQSIAEMENTLQRSQIKQLEFNLQKMSQLNQQSLQSIKTLESKVLYYQNKVKAFSSSYNKLINLINLILRKVVQNLLQNKDFFVQATLNERQVQQQIHSVIQEEMLELKSTFKEIESKISRLNQAYLTEKSCLEDTTNYSKSHRSRAKQVLPDEDTTNPHFSFDRTYFNPNMSEQQFFLSNNFSVVPRQENLECDKENHKISEQSLELSFSRNLRSISPAKTSFHNDQLERSTRRQNDTADKENKNFMKSLSKSSLRKIDDGHLHMDSVRQMASTSGNTNKVTSEDEFEHNHAPESLPRTREPEISLKEQINGRLSVGRKLNTSRVNSVASSCLPESANSSISTTTKRVFSRLPSAKSSCRSSTKGSPLKMGKFERMIDKPVDSNVKNRSLSNPRFILEKSKAQTTQTKTGQGFTKVADSPGTRTDRMKQPSPQKERQVQRDVQCIEFPLQSNSSKIFKLTLEKPGLYQVRDSSPFTQKTVR